MVNIIDKLKELNPDIEIHSITEPVLKKYGKILDIDTDEIVSACEKIEMPKNGSCYVTSEKSLEALECGEALRNMSFGGCDVQIGLCYGYNSAMNAMEFHRSSEINIAVTDLVLILGLEPDVMDKEYSSANVKAFYLKKGSAVEVYGTTLHFCPCQVSDGGFSCVVILPKGTNEPLEFTTDDKLLFKKNKWLICHDENKALIDKGVYPGIHGKNYEIKY